MKVTIIGLGLVGNSIGMALKRASVAQAAPAKEVRRGDAPPPPPIEVVGLDPDRQHESDAMRKYASVDTIAPDLQRAIEGADLVVVATPPSAVREVFAAIDPYLSPETIVTDTLPSKEQVMKWANETLRREINFVSGHALLSSDDSDAVTDRNTPNPDLFQGARWAIMPRAGSTDEALNTVIWLAETAGATPLFIDPFEHDAFVAAINHLPMLASAALWRVAHTSPSWGDMEPFARGGFKTSTAPLSTPPEMMAGALETNRRTLLGWVDRYMIALQELRDMLAESSGPNEDSAIFAALTEAQDSYRAWLSESSITADEKEAKLRAALREEIDDARPSRSLMGTYLSERIFRKREK